MEVGAVQGQILQPMAGLQDFLLRRLLSTRFLCGIAALALAPGLCLDDHQRKPRQPAEGLAISQDKIEFQCLADRQCFISPLCLNWVLQPESQELGFQGR